MNLKSNINLTYSFGNVNGDTETGIVDGVIHRHEKGIDGIINVLFSYLDADGNKIKTDWFPITEAEADALYSAVKTNLPDIDSVGFSAWNEALFYEGFRVEMASTFGVNVADIDIVS